MRNKDWAGMSKNKASPLIGGLILAGFVVIALGVLFGVRATLRSQDHGGHGGQHSSWADTQADSHIELTRLETTPFALASAEPNLRPGATVRTLNEYYSRRAYAGAPPVIPHPVVNDGVINDDCLSCHQDGGFVPEQNCYTPITPHPEMGNCRQCHVAQTTEQLFVDTEWKQPDLPKRGRQALPGGPLQMPHTLHFHDNCLACHTGPHAVVEIRTSHPERENCTQCHVPDVGLPPFKSLIDPRMADAEK
jgi:nitrate reductase cytochrome c-type subunit